MRRITHTARIVHYYELIIGYTPLFSPNESYPFRAVVQTIIDAVTQKKEIRLYDINYRTVCIRELRIDNDTQLAYGKLCAIRRDANPELINILTDSTRDLIIEENEGIIETSHFVIDFKRKFPLVALEFNQQGAKITDFIYYVNRIGRSANLIDSLVHRSLIRDTLDTIQRRIGRTSRIKAKVVKENLANIESQKPGLASAFQSAMSQFDNEYVTLEWKFNYRQQKENNEVRDFVVDIVDTLIKNKLFGDNFEEFVVDAEDEDNHNHLSAFDLLADKVRSKLNVERRADLNVLVSSHMFELITQELIRRDL